MEQIVSLTYSPPKRWSIAYTIALGLLFLTISAQHPTEIMFVPIADKSLFLHQGMSIVTGQWLGTYSAHTLVKGAGYPLFLALNYMTGLPIGIGQNLLYFAAVMYAGLVLSKLSRSRTIFFLLPPLLLTLPVLYSSELQRLLREYFYVAISLFIFAALFDVFLAKPNGGLRLGRAVILGLLCGVFWITREEGVWIAPAIIITLAFAALKQKGQQRQASWRGFAAKICIVVASVGLVLVTVGSLNKHFYGRFVLNEIKDSSFEDALNALQRASYQYHKAYLPVPKQARLLIYQQSPSLAKLKSYLDPDGKPSPWNYGCNLPIYRSVCGDIAGGWFVWAIRDAAQSVGMYKNADTAAQFYESITREVDLACAQGRLTCASWLPPLVPYMSYREILGVPSHIARILDFIVMRPPLSFDAGKSSIEDGARERVLEFLNYPTHFEAPPGVQFSLNGWFKGSGNEWITFDGVGLQGKLTVSRDPSPDLVLGFHDPQLDHNRFTVKGTCSKAESCLLSIRDQHEHTLNVGVLTLKAPSGITFAGGAINFDGLQLTSRNFISWRTKLYDGWSQLTLVLKPYLSALVIVGWLVLAAVTILALYLRQLSQTLIGALTLAIAVLSRAALLGLVDAASFPAAAYKYSAPATPLAMAVAILAIFECFRLIAKFRMQIANRSYERTSKPPVPTVKDHNRPSAG